MIKSQKKPEKICSACRKETLPGAKFCHRCGRELSFPKTRGGIKWKVLVGFSLGFLLMGLLFFNPCTRTLSESVERKSSHFPQLFKSGNTSGQPSSEGEERVNGSSIPNTYRQERTPSSSTIVLSQHIRGWEWTRDENGLPFPLATVEYVVSNQEGTPLTSVRLSRAEGESWEIPNLSVGEIYRGNFKVKGLAVWEKKNGWSFLSGFRISSELTAEWGGRKVTNRFSGFIPRSELEMDDRYAPYASPYLVTPADPVVKITLQKLAEKSKFDFRPFEDYLADWVSGGVTGIDPNAGVTYDFEKLNVSKWFQEYGFWTQLPRETITRKKGVCIDQAVLYVSLLRAYGYKPEDVYVVCGIPAPDLQKMFGEVSGHAWVVYKRKMLGTQFWVIAEVTSGGINRVLTASLAPIWDSLMEVLGKEGFKLYKGAFAFNDVYFRELEGKESKNFPAGITFREKSPEVKTSLSKREENLKERIQKLVNSLRMPAISAQEMKKYRDRLLDYYIDRFRISLKPEYEGAKNPVNLLIFVQAPTKEEAKEAIISMFLELGYSFPSWISDKVRWIDEMYPSPEEIELFREFFIPKNWPKNHMLENLLLDYLQFHLKGMYVCVTELGHLWAICAHVEYADSDPINHFRGKKITQEQVEVCPFLAWPYVKWESFEKDLKFRLAFKPSEWQIEGHKVKWIENIWYGNLGYFEGTDSYFYNDGMLPVILLEKNF